MRVKPKVIVDERGKAAEMIALSIEAISRAMKAINETRLTRRAIVALIKDHSGLTKGCIEIVLNNLENLEKIYLKPKRPAQNGS